MLESWDDGIADAAIAALRKLEEDDSRRVSEEAQARYEAFAEGQPESPGPASS
jgi:hypothetical protein